MTNLIKKYLTLFLSLIILLNFHPVNAANFNVNLREIRAEINRDNLQEAIKKIKKIKISNENEQEKIDLLFVYSQSINFNLLFLSSINIFAD